MEKIDSEEFKEIKSIVDYSKKFFANIDESFFGGLAELLLNIRNRMKSLKVKSTNYDTHHLPGNLDFDKVEEFYRSLSPDLGNMARNELRYVNVFVPRENLSNEDIQFRGKKVKSLEDTASDNIPLSNSWEGVLVTIHEMAHRFPMQKSNNIICYVLDETIAIYAELLGRDFIKEKYDTEINFSLLIRYLAYNLDPHGTLDIEILRLLKSYVRLLRTEELGDNNILKYRRILNSFKKSYNDFFYKKEDSKEIPTISEISSMFYGFDVHNLRFYIG